MSEVPGVWALELRMQGQAQDPDASFSHPGLEEKFEGQGRGAMQVPLFSFYLQ